MAVGHGLGWPHRNQLLQNLGGDQILVKMLVPKFPKLNRHRNKS